MSKPMTLTSRSQQRERQRVQKHADRDRLQARASARALDRRFDADLAIGKVIVSLLKPYRTW